MGNIVVTQGWDQEYQIGIYCRGPSKTSQCLGVQGLNSQAVQLQGLWQFENLRATHLVFDARVLKNISYSFAFQRQVDKKTEVQAGITCPNSQSKLGAEL